MVATAIKPKLARRLPAAPKAEATLATLLAQLGEATVAPTSKAALTERAVQMIKNPPSSLVKKTEYAAALNNHGLKVEKWIFLDDHAIAD